ncbi:MAG: Ldh family oxidoreductase [Rhodospirillales bacterium]|nr:Ldh family oxidoreductase [Rhodospirillales bacterium]
MTAQTGQPRRKIDANVLRDLMERLLMAAGCDGENARGAADGYLEADLRGHTIQGLDHMYSTLGRIQKREVNGKSKPRIVRETEATALIDGDTGEGHFVGCQAVEIGIRKARAAGSCMVGLINTDDIFMLGYYAHKFADAGLVSLIFTNSFPVRVHPAGGIDPVLGTNPIGIGVPTAEGFPLIWDSATSTSAIGHIRIASYRGDPIPAGVAVDADGRPTRDAVAALKGALTPLAGAKGYGLGLCAAILSGLLISADLGSVLRDAFARGDGTKRRGHSFIAIDPRAFGDAARFRAAASAHLKQIKSSRKTPGVRDILVPGERALALRERSLKEGVLILESVWQNTGKLAAGLGVAMPA